MKQIHPLVRKTSSCALLVYQTMDGPPGMTHPFPPPDPFSTFALDAARCAMCRPAARGHHNYMIYVGPLRSGAIAEFIGLSQLL